MHKHLMKVAELLKKCYDEKSKVLFWGKMSNY